MARTEKQILEELLEVQQMQFRLNRGNFLDFMVKSGKARHDIAAYTLSIAAAGTSTVTVTNLENMVWIPHYEVIWVETANVMAAVLTRDGRSFLTVPALPTAFEFPWNTIVPWLGMGVIYNDATIVFTNSGSDTCWVIAGYIGTYVDVTAWDQYLQDLYRSYSRYMRY